jgi:hypothetical protein
VFNYNRSRQAAFRGVRGLAVTLDGSIIFEGELRRAPGRVVQQQLQPAASDLQRLSSLPEDDGDAPRNILEECSETILFTLDTGILSAIAAQDPYVALTRDGGPGGAVDYLAAACIEEAAVRVAEQRPPTAEAPLLVPPPQPARVAAASTTSIPQRSRSAIRRRIRRREIIRQQSEQQPQPPVNLAGEGVHGDPRQSLAAQSSEPLPVAAAGLITSMNDGFNAKLPLSQSAATANLTVQSPARAVRRRTSIDVASNAATTNSLAPTVNRESAVDTGDLQSSSVPVDDDAAALEAELRALFREDESRDPKGADGVSTVTPVAPIPVVSSKKDHSVHSADSASDDEWEVELLRLMEGGGPNPRAGEVSLPPEESSKLLPQQLQQQQSALDEDEEDLLNDLMASRNALMLRPLVASLAPSREASTATDTASMNAASGADGGITSLTGSVDGAQKSANAGEAVEDLQVLVDAPAMLTSAELQWGARGREGAVLPLATLPFARDITLSILSTHGDPHYAGLTGLRVWVAQPMPGHRTASGNLGRVVEHPLTVQDLRACPADINVDGHSGDQRTVDKLVDGTNVTTDDLHMWLIPFSSSQAGGPRGFAPDRGSHVLRIRLPSAAWIAGITVYNYNKSPDDTHRGVKHIALALGKSWVRHTLGNVGSHTGGPSSSGSDIIPLRRAPGDASFDFGQRLDFELCSKGGGGNEAVEVRLARPAFPALAPPSTLIVAADQPQRAHSAAAHQQIRQDFEVASAATGPPVGHVLRLAFSGTWGDPFYQGVDACALYDAAGIRIPVFPWQVTASPFGLASSDSEHCASPVPIASDARTAANLGYVHSNEEDWRGDDECSRRRDDPLLYVASSIPLPPARSSIVAAAAQCAADAFPAARSWLAPLPAPHHDTGLRTPAVVTFAFDAPVAISLIRIFNYSKTPARGAAEVEVTLDGVLIFAGELADATLGGLHSVASLRAAVCASALGAGARVPRPCNSIVLSDDRALLLTEAQGGRLHFCGTTEQQVLCFNAGRMALNVSSAKAVKVAQALQQSLTAQQHQAGTAAYRPGKAAQRPRTAVLVV